jgi:hypothetical protein
LSESRDRQYPGRLLWLCHSEDENLVFADAIENCVGKAVKHAWPFAAAPAREAKRRFENAARRLINL